MLCYIILSPSVNVSVSLKDNFTCLFCCVFSLYNPFFCVYFLIYWYASLFCVFLCLFLDILLYAFHISFILGFMWCVPEGGLSTHPTATDPEKQTFLAFQTLLGLFKTQCHNKCKFVSSKGPKIRGIFWLIHIHTLHTNWTRKADNFLFLHFNPPWNDLALPFPQPPN